jgi:hypothetical protein
MTQVKTETGKLLDGVPFGDAFHFDFEIRLPVMKITGQALEETEDKYGTIEGYAADSFYRTAVFAGALIRLGDIPPEELTAELLNDYLTEDDYDVLSAAVKRLKVKRNGGNPGSPDSDSPPLPSDDTASPKTK